MDLAKIIDQTNIKKNATVKEIKKTCLEAKKYGFRGVCVLPKWVKLVKKELAGSGIKVVVLIDPPMGLLTHLRRIKLCQKAKKDGADELDVVMSVVDLKYERYEKILNDLKPITKILPTKVIIGSGYLTDEEIKIASQLVKKSGAICVKTACPKDPLESRELNEKVRHLKIMKQSATGLLIKASGNIKTFVDVQKMLKAGADIIGTSYGVEILKQIKNQST